MTNRPLAFICSPYAGDIEKNVARARELCRLAVDDGYTPIAPHLLYPQFLSEETERNLGIEMGLQWLEFCHIMYVAGSCSISAGMQRELTHAKRFDVVERWVGR